MTPVPVPFPEATMPGRPTAESARALRQALGYIATADAPSTRRGYIADWRYFDVRRLHPSSSGAWQRAPAFLSGA